MNMAPSQDSPENKPKNPEAIQRDKVSSRKWQVAEFNMLRNLMNKPKIVVSPSKTSEENIPTEGSPERIKDAEELRRKARNEAGKYYGPSDEELARRNLIIKSMQIDKDFIISKKIFIQELIKQDEPKFREEIQHLKAEVTELEAKLLEKREDVAKSITTVIDEIEAATPGLVETLAEERKLLEKLKQSAQDKKDEEDKNLAIS